MLRMLSYVMAREVLHTIAGVRMAHEDHHECWVADLDAKLAPRERAVAALRLGGSSVRDVAQELGIQQTSVRTTMHRVYRKCGVANLDELRVVLTAPIDKKDRPSESSSSERGHSMYGIMRMVAEAFYVLCAPVAVEYLMFMHASPLRYHLNDMAVVGLMVLGACAALTCGPLLKKRLAALAFRFRVIVATVLAACLIALFGEVLFKWMLLGRAVPMEGNAYAASYALCSIIPCLVACVGSTTRLGVLDVLRLRPPVLCVVLVIQVVIATRMPFGGSAATVLFAAVICASSFLLCCADPLSELGSCLYAGLHDLRVGVASAPVQLCCISSISFGVSLSSALLSSVNAFIELVSCVPAAAIIVCVGYAMYRVTTASRLQVLLRCGAMACLVWLVSMAAYSYLMGLLAGAAIVLVCARHTLRFDVELLKDVKRWDWLVVLPVCAGVLLGMLCIWMAASLPSPMRNAHTTFALQGLFGVGVVLAAVLWGLYAIGRLCQIYLDVVAAKSDPSVQGPDDLQRMRAFLVLRGMSELECEVALRTVAGTRIQEIARDVQYSTSSVKAARARVYRVLGVHSVAGLRLALSQAIAA